MGLGLGFPRSKPARLAADRGGDNVGVSGIDWLGPESRSSRRRDSYAPPAADPTQARTRTCFFSSAGPYGPLARERKPHRSNRKLEAHVPEPLYGNHQTAHLNRRGFLAEA